MLRQGSVEVIEIMPFGLEFKKLFIYTLRQLHERRFYTMSQRSPFKWQMNKIKNISKKPKNVNIVSQTQKPIYKYKRVTYRFCNF